MAQPGCPGWVLLAIAHVGRLTPAAAVLLLAALRSNAAAAWLVLHALLLR